MSSPNNTGLRWIEENNSARHEDDIKTPKRLIKGRMTGTPPSPSNTVRSPAAVAAMAKWGTSSSTGLPKEILESLPCDSKDMDKKDVTATHRKRRTTFRDLCVEDKQRIANLIRELAVTTQVKEDTCNELEESALKIQEMKLEVQQANARTQEIQKQTREANTQIQELSTQLEAERSTREAACARADSEAENRERAVRSAIEERDRAVAEAKTLRHERQDLVEAVSSLRQEFTQAIRMLEKRKMTVTSDEKHLLASSPEHPSSSKIKKSAGEVMKAEKVEEAAALLTSTSLENMNTIDSTGAVISSELQSLRELSDTLRDKLQQLDAITLAQESAVSKPLIHTEVPVTKVPEIINELGSGNTETKNTLRNSSHNVRIPPTPVLNSNLDSYPRRNHHRNHHQQHLSPVEWDDNDDSSSYEYDVDMSRIKNQQLGRRKRHNKHQSQPILAQQSQSCPTCRHARHQHHKNVSETVNIQSVSPLTSSFVANSKQQHSVHSGNNIENITGNKGIEAAFTQFLASRSVESQTKSHDHVYRSTSPSSLLDIMEDIPQKVQPYQNIHKKTSLQCNDNDDDLDLLITSLNGLDKLPGL